MICLNSAGSLTQPEVMIDKWASGIHLTQIPEIWLVLLRDRRLNTQTALKTRQAVVLPTRPFQE
jgi:hypothetical protein